MVGIVTGRRIGKNRDGDKNVLLLQVEIIENEDVRTIEIFSSGDFNPANGTRVYICNVSDSYQVAVATSDGLTPECEAGEREFYSTDNPATQKKARLKLNKDGEIVLNQGTKSAVNFLDLNTQLQLLVTAINAALATKLDGSGAAGALTLDLSTAEVPEVML